MPKSALFYLPSSFLLVCLNSLYCFRVGEVNLHTIYTGLFTRELLSMNILVAIIILLTIFNYFSSVLLLPRLQVKLSHIGTGKCQSYSDRFWSAQSNISRSNLLYSFLHAARTTAAILSSCDRIKHGLTPSQNLCDRWSLKNVAYSISLRCSHKQFGCPCASILKIFPKINVDLMQTKPFMFELWQQAIIVVWKHSDEA